MLWYGETYIVAGIPCTNCSIFSRDMSITLICFMLSMIIINTGIYTAIWLKLAYRKRNLNVKTSKLARTRMMILVSAGYSVCWIPLFITLTIELVDTAQIERVFCPAEYLTLIAFINSGINWAIYGLADQKFRNAFKMLLCQLRRITIQK